MHAELALEPHGQAGDYLPRIDAAFRGAPHAGQQAVGIHRRRALGDLVGREQFAPAFGLCAKLGQHLGFVRLMGQVKRTGLLVPEIGTAQHVEPELAAPQGHVAHRTLRLTDWPEHAEVAHRCAASALAALEHDDPPSLAGQMKSMGQSEHAGSDHGIVVFFLHDNQATPGRQRGADSRHTFFMFYPLKCRLARTRRARGFPCPEAPARGTPCVRDWGPSPLRPFRV